VPDAKEIAFLLSFLTLAGGALLGTTGELLPGAVLALVGVVGAFIFGDRPL
jgi:hypothetical protein